MFLIQELIDSFIMLVSIILFLFQKKTTKYQSIGSTDPRLTQTPSIFKLPPLPSGSVNSFVFF
jgi:hypothetical protein